MKQGGLQTELSVALANQIDSRAIATELLAVLQKYIDQAIRSALGTVAIRGGAPAAELKRSPMFSDCTDPFIEEKSRTTREHRGYSRQTTAQSLVTFRLWTELVGDRPVRTYVREDAGRFRSLLLKLPANHGKARKPLSAFHAIRNAEKAKRDIPRLTMKTAKRHFSTMSQLWVQLRQFGHVPENIFSGFSFPGARSSRRRRDDWNAEQLEALFRSSRWCVEAKRDTAEWWLPLIALFSGMRLEEICRLRPSFDLRPVEGLPCFLVQEQTDWSPKSDAGTRIVPVHRFLQDLGLMELVDRRRTGGSERLFPELAAGGPDKKLGFKFSREFSKYKVTLGITSTRVVFHSFRHTFRTVLESSDLKSSWIDAVMGHEGVGSEGRTYTKRVAVRRLDEVVQAFSSPVDLSFLIR